VTRRAFTILGRASVAVAAAVSLLLGFQSEALACCVSTAPAGYVSVWEGCGSSDVGYCGAAQPFPVSGKHGVCQNFGSYMNDRDSAVSNNTGYRARFYGNANCDTGIGYWDIYGHTETGALTAGQGKNKWSSVRFD
jgi:hypothetical protein